MPNQSWIKIRRENGKEDYAQVSRSKHYPEQSTKRTNVQPEVHSTQEGHTLDQLYTAPDDGKDLT